MTRPNLREEYDRITGFVWADSQFNRACSYIALVCVVGIWTMLLLTWRAS